MEKEILKKIKEYHKIIIHRHSRPDMDAIGSQMGLYYGLKNHFPTKEIYVVGDINDFSFEAVMDQIDDQVYQGALAIVLDVSQSERISDSRYTLAKELIIIDHHTNYTDLNPVIFLKLSNYTSACAIIAQLFKDWKLDLTSEAATYLYCGMVTDTGRFTHITAETAAKTFELASYVTQFGPRIADIYEYLYLEPLAKRLTKIKFANFELTPNKVAYRKNDANLIAESGLDFFSISRGMISNMAGIKEVEIWANFTEDITNAKIVAELRSRKISIVDIAKKYGGGGHDKACGASLSSWDDVELMLKDLDERVEENAKRNL